MLMGGSGQGNLKIESSSINILTVSAYFFPKSIKTFSEANVSELPVVAVDVIEVGTDDTEDALDTGAWPWTPLRERHGCCDWRMRFVAFRCALRFSN